MADLPFTLDQLRILRAIVSEGSFKIAADTLYVTQPAVSLQIQNLEMKPIIGWDMLHHSVQNCCEKRIRQNQLMNIKSMRSNYWIKVHSFH